MRTLKHKPLKHSCWRAAAALLLGIVSTLAIAWFPNTIWQPARPFPISKGTGIVDGLTVSLMRVSFLTYDGQTWIIRDPNDGGWDAKHAQRTAQQIAALGGARYDAELLGLVQSVGGPSNLPMFIETRIDDELQRGVPPHILTGPPPQCGVTVSVYRYGWPMRAVTCSSRFATEFGPISAKGVPTILRSIEQNSGRIDIPLSRTKTRVLPLAYHPLPLGFLANTALYSTLWFLPITGIGLLRTRRRRVQQRCLNCGYDRRGLNAAAPCPECGTEASHASDRPKA